MRGAPTASWLHATRRALLLYTADAKRAIAACAAGGRQDGVRIGAVTAELTPVGHLLGAQPVTLRHHEATLVFRRPRLRQRPADALLQRIAHADVLGWSNPPTATERTRRKIRAGAGAIIRATLRRGGSVLLPTFRVVGRAQALLLVLQRLKAVARSRPSAGVPRQSGWPSGRHPAGCTSATARRCASRREANALCEGVTLVERAQDSEKLARSRYPSVILSASGMATGGRAAPLLGDGAEPAPPHHLFPGFQVAGTRGASWWSARLT